MISSKDEPTSVASNVNQEEPMRGLGEGTGAASLDKVRDILFGGQMRDVDRRFARLEERLIKETNDLKEDVKRRLDALEKYARQESETLAGQLKAEHDDRVESDSGLSRELQEAVRTIEKRTAALDDQLGKSQRELRQQMLEQHQQLSDDIKQKVDEVLAALAREAHELRNDKADRRALASLLTEMAMRLNNEFRIPGAEDLGNG
jgi:DNA anti-recombination protein RmuC